LEREREREMNLNAVVLPGNVGQVDKDEEKSRGAEEGGRGDEKKEERATLNQLKTIERNGGKSVKEEKGATKSFEKEGLPQKGKNVSQMKRCASENLFVRPSVSPLPLAECQFDEGTRFKRVVFSEGEDTSLDSESVDAVRKIREMLSLRDKYVYQKPAIYWGSYDPQKYQDLYDKDTAMFEAKGRWRKEMPFFARTAKRKGSHPFTLARKTPHLFKRSSGVFRVYIPGDTDTSAYYEKPPSMDEFYRDYMRIVEYCNLGPIRTLAYKRLRLLSARFHLHEQLNREAELREQKHVPHRDFYNVRKVDTHVHHSSFMTQKHLLRFIKSKLRKFPDDKVLKIPDSMRKDGEDGSISEDAFNLAQLFMSMKLTAYDLSVDTLDMHAHKTFKRFDRFNQKYNPIGQSRLRTVFLKYDNYMKGRYLAELTREVIDDLELNKYSYSEPRLSIYGRSPDEFHKLGEWFYDNDLASNNVRWMIQIPRLYQIWKGKGIVHDFGEMIDNIFRPLFEVTADPESDPKLAAFLEQVVAFDCVDDESQLEPSFDPKQLVVPEAWDSDQNPAYSYWMYFIYANLLVLNRFRAHKGLSTFSLRPHAGEAGSVNHLAVTYLLAEHINHGILLKDSPPLQYLYYLKQIGLGVSPLSNNKLFLEYNKNPFVTFFRRGLNVSLSTDDPLQFHYTKEPLVEEYCVAAQVWKLSACDMCEIARNSVLQSGFEYPYKKHFLGDQYYKYPHPSGNDIELTNVPNIRVLFRYEVFQSELDFLSDMSSLLIPSYRVPPPSPSGMALRKMVTERWKAPDMNVRKRMEVYHAPDRQIRPPLRTNEEEDEKGCEIKCRPSAMCSIQ